MSNQPDMLATGDRVYLNQPNYGPEDKGTVAECRFSGYFVKWDDLWGIHGPFQRSELTYIEED